MPEELHKVLGSKGLDVLLCQLDLVRLVAEHLRDGVRLELEWQLAENQLAKDHAE